MNIETRRPVNIAFLTNNYSKELFDNRGSVTFIDRERKFNLKTMNDIIVKDTFRGFIVGWGIRSKDPYQPGNDNVIQPL